MLSNLKRITLLAVKKESAIISVFEIATDTVAFTTKFLALATKIYSVVHILNCDQFSA